MFKSIQNSCFFHVSWSSISLDIAYTAHPHTTYMKGRNFSLWSLEPTLARGLLEPLALRALALLLLEAEALKLLAVRSRCLTQTWPIDIYHHIPIANCIHSLLTSMLQRINSLAFFAPPAFINPFMVHFQLGFFLLLCMSQKYFCFRCSNVTKEKKCNGGYLMSSILVFVLSIMDVQRGWGLVREGMASLCVGQPFFFQQMLIL